MTTTTNTIKALRDALEFISHGPAIEDCKRVAKSALALTADASEDAPDASREPSRAQINEWMRDVGWQNIDIRQADLPKVEKVVRLALAARPAPVGAGMAADGWQWVPKEPTDEMRLACIHQSYHWEIDEDWDLMLAAAPAAPVADTVPANPRTPVADAGGAVVLTDAHIMAMDDEIMKAPRGYVFQLARRVEAHILGKVPPIEGEQCKECGNPYSHPAEQAKPEAGEQAVEVKPRTMSMCATKDYMHGWNDCLKAVGTGKPSELEKKIDTAIEIARELLHQRHDRRGPVRPHEPERRDGFDRRARVAPVKE